MNKKLILRLARYTKPYLKYLLAALLCAMAGAALSLMGPVLIGRAVDRIAGTKQVDFPGLMRVLISFSLVTLLGAGAQWLSAVWTNKASHLTVRDLRAGIFGKLMRLPFKYLDTMAQGDLMNRVVNDIDQIGEGLVQGLSQLFSGVVLILGTLGFMVSIHPLIALVVAALTPVSLFLAAFIARRTHRMFMAQARAQGDLAAYVEEMVAGSRVVKAFGREAPAFEGFQALNRELYGWGLQAQIYPAFTNPLTRFVNGLVFAAVGVTGALAAIRGQMTVGQLTSFLSYANQYTKPFNEVTGILAQLQTAFSSARRVFDVMDALEETPDDPAAPRLHRAPGHVALQEVSFRYEADRPLIQGINLQAEPGQRVAIVGPTGCGKTTLINLLMRFFDPDEGKITVEGQDIRHMTRADLRAQYAMVLQDTWLQSATVRENIAYGRPEASLEEVIAAAKAAHADGFITRLEKGYDTLLTENGGNLSQGQKQLLCIARAMLLNPPMLILDEATSSIDTRTEIRVQKAFAKMMEGRTSFVVAHRLATIREADLILVMRDGRVVEQGGHEELLQKGGFYASLYESQFAKTGEESTF